MLNCKRCSLVLSALLIVGCTSNQSDKSFERVQQGIEARGGYIAHWPADHQMQQQLVDETLGDGELGAEEAVRLALGNNADLQAELDELGIAHADLMQATLLPNPVLHASVRFLDGGGGEIIEMGIAQNLIDLLLVPKRKQLARSGVAMAEQRASAAMLDLAAETRSAYRRYQAQLARVELYQSVVTATSLSADMAERLRKAGNVIELKVSREEAMYQRARLLLAEAKGEAMLRRESLTALLGLWGERASNWDVPPRLPTPEPMQVDPAKLESNVLAKSIDLELKRMAINVVAQRAGIEEFEQTLPDLEAGAEAEREPGGQWSVGPTLGVALPVFDFGQGVRAKEAAKVRQAINRYTGLAVRLRASARSTYTIAQTNANTSRFLREKLLPLQTEVTEQTQLQFNAMQIGVFQLLSAKRTEIETAEQYLTTLEDHWLARIRLETLQMGRLPEQRFGINAGGSLGGDTPFTTPNNDGGH